MFKLTTKSTMTNFNISQDQKHGVQRLTKTINQKTKLLQLLQ